VRVTGRVATAAATELSGLVLSRSQPGVLWALNDSGDRPRVLALATTGRLLADVAVTGAQNVDWEDIAAVRGAGAPALLIGDIGDNVAGRPSIVVYRVAEPRAGAGAATTTAPAQRLELRYSDGPHDAEALMVDPSDGALVIVTKSFGGRSGVYVAERPAPGAVTTLRRRARLRLGVGEAVTAGDVSADGRTIVVRTYDRVYAWTRRGGERVATVMRRKPCTARPSLLLEGQGESIALTRGGRAFYTIPEGLRPLMREYLTR
jgi:hypothetical protein